MTIAKKREQFQEILENYNFKKDYFVSFFVIKILI